VALLAAFGFAAGCSGATEPSRGEPGLDFIAGSDVTDTVQARPSPALTTIVRDEAGLPVPGVTVRFQSVVAAAGSASPLTPGAFVELIASGRAGSFVVDTTDASGRASATVKLGIKAGVAGVVVTAPAYGYADTVEFTVRPGSAMNLALRVADTVTSVGNGYAIGAMVTDAYGNQRTSDVLTYEATPGLVSVDATGAVKALAVGRATIVARSGGITGTAHLSIVPDGILVVVAQGTKGRSIATVRLDGTGLTPLAAVVSDYLLPRWDRAGTRIAYYEFNPAQNAVSYEVDLLGNRARIIDTRTPSVQFFPRYSPDGQWVYFSAADPVAPFYYALWRARSDGTSAEVMARSGVSNSWEGSPSTDGTRVVFAANGSLCILDLATRGLACPGVQGGMPEYSPDGRRIAFRSPDGHLGVMNADGTNARLSPSAGYDEFNAPSWSSDGKWIVIGRGAADAGDLMNASTFEVIPLSSLRGIAQPAFKP
jgi:hypothetical protein